MALNVVTRFGAYEVLAVLGAGGMGEVYRATDTNLGRQVAIEMLPQLYLTIRIPSLGSNAKRKSWESPRCGRLHPDVRRL